MSEEPSKSPRIALIAACDMDNAIGRGNDLPWHVPEDLKYFKDTTEGHVVLMGRSTWDSIPEEYRPLKNRLNTVLTHNEFFKAPAGVLHGTFAGLRSQLDGLFENPQSNGVNSDRLFVIGGTSIYKVFMPYAHEIFMTRIFTHAEDCDTFFPEMPGTTWEIAQSRSGETKMSRSGLRYRHLVFERRFKPAKYFR